MEWIVSMVVLVAILFLGIRMMPAKGVNSISTRELQKKLDEPNITFIDVRTEAEYKAKHIPEFKNMPLGSDLSGLPQDHEIIVICKSGIRSSQACKQLVKLGYTNVTNVRRGINGLRVAK